MAHVGACHAVATGRIAEPVVAIREVLYKADHPRAIDQYIDFFGDGELSDIAGDRCGELFLESLA